MINTLGDFLARFHELGHSEAFRYFNGFRTWKVTYRDLLQKSGGCARFFDAQKIVKGDRIALWGENRPEWAAVFWAAIARGIQVVPADFNSSSAFVKRIQAETDPKLIIHGDDVDPSSLDLPKLSYEEIRSLGDAVLEPVAIDPHDVVEIVYTSGTTSNPKGVVHRHRNICANLRPVVEEIGRYRYLATPFQPIRFLNLLPLSHMFGQSMTLFIPPLLGGSSVFMRGLSPASIMETIRREKVSILVAVPRMVEQLRHHVTGVFGPAKEKMRTSGLPSILEKWLKHRKFHLSAGFKFWAIVVGGAQLSEEVERFWSSLGVLVVQGYGLTEASPIVSINHPFRTRLGSIGKPIKGQELKISGEGEILIRGENVVLHYLGDSSPGNRVTSDGWLRTGDLGEYDADGNLLFKGRKTEIIVTSAGLNIYPQDVETILRRRPEIKGAVVVGLTVRGEEQVHAALILEKDSRNPQQIVNAANRSLEKYQRISSWTLWPHEDFPRTPSTLKINRKQVTEEIRSATPDLNREKGGNPDWVARLLRSRGEPQPQYSDDHDLELDLGLSSLDRIELLAHLQEDCSAQLDETTFAQLTTIGEVSSWLEESARARSKDKRFPRLSRTRSRTTPRWTRWFPVRIFRDAVQLGLILPLFRRHLEFSVSGIEHLNGLRPPVIFAANHCSNLDTIALLAALPYAWRAKLAPAIRQEYFAAHFQEAGFSLRDRIRSSLEYYIACTLFNTFPIPQRMGGIQKTLKYAGELVEQEWCPLLFPEGGRSKDGRIQPFKPGIGVMATRLQVPVVPVFIGGLFQVLSRNDSWPQSGRCSLNLGSPLRISTNLNPKMAAKQVETSVRSLESQHLSLGRSETIKG